MGLGYNAPMLVRGGVWGAGGMQQQLPQQGLVAQGMQAQQVLQQQQQMLQHMHLQQLQQMQLQQMPHQSAIFMGPNSTAPLQVSPAGRERYAPSPSLAPGKEGGCSKGKGVGARGEGQGSPHT